MEIEKVGVKNRIQHMSVRAPCFFAAFISLFSYPAAARTSTGIWNSMIWKAGTNGVAKIHVCFETQNSATQETWVKEAVNLAWPHFANIDFTYSLADVPLKGNGTSFKCDENFPGIKIKFIDDAEGPRTQLGETGLSWIKADAGTEANWPQGTRVSKSVNIFLNPTFNNWMGSANLSSGEKVNAFKHFAVHEFGHALGFAHEQELPAASAALSQSCMAYIKKQESFQTEKEKSSLQFEEYGTYSRLSIMHYNCMMDSAYKPRQGEVFLFQTALGPTDIATVRKKYGIRNPNSFPKANWGTPTTPGLEGITITGNESQSELRSKLGDAPSNVYVNHRYYTVSSLPIPSGPGPQRIDTLKLKLPSNLYYASEAPIGPNGHPYVLLPGMGGNARIEYSVVPSSRAVGGVNYPGYEIALKSLDAEFAQAVPEEMTLLYSDIEAAGFSAFNVKFEKVGGASPDRKVLYLNKPPVLKVVWPSLGHYTNQPHTVVPQAEFKFWIPKGHGSFDPQAGEFFTLHTSAPKDKNWYYTTDGKFRVNSDYTQMDLRVSALRISANNNVSTYNPPEKIRILFPKTPADPAAYFTRVGVKFGSLVKIPGNGKQGNERINSFYMMETETTQKEYQVLMGKNPFHFPLGPNYPVEGTTLFDAVIYSNIRSDWEGLEPVYSFSNPVYSANGLNCIGLSNLTADFNRTGYRLPTLAEWRHAYSEGTSQFHWPAGSQPDNYTWHNGNSGYAPHPVAQKIPNDRLLYDISGNVLEWVWSGSPNHGYQSGGSWYDNYGSHNKYTAIGEPAGAPCAHTGFRLVRKAPVDPFESLILLLLD